MRKQHFVNNPLREYRLKNYLLQEEIARRCGMHHTMWSFMECLKRTPSLEMAYRISQRTGIPLIDMARFFSRRKTPKEAKE